LPDGQITLIDFDRSIARARRLTPEKRLRQNIDFTNHLSMIGAFKGACKNKSLPFFRNI